MTSTISARGVIRRVTSRLNRLGPGIWFRHEGELFITARPRVGQREVEWHDGVAVLPARSLSDGARVWILETTRVEIATKEASAFRELAARVRQGGISRKVRVMDALPGDWIVEGTASHFMIVEIEERAGGQPGRSVALTFKTGREYNCSKTYLGYRIPNFVRGKLI